MRRLLKKIIRRLFGAGGYAVIDRAAYDKLQETIAETKGGVSQLQQQVGAALPQLHKIIAESKGGVSQLQQEMGDTLSQVAALRKELAELRGRFAAQMSGAPEARSNAKFDLAYNPSPRFTEWLVENHALSTSLVVIDVGVQGGVGPRWDHLRDRLEVHGFDALEEAIAPLEALCRTNHRYYAMALGNEDGEREIFVAPEPTATSFYRHNSSSYGVDERVSRSAGVRRVPIRRLDTLLAEGAFRRADFIKIDCEGFEPEILKGMQALLRKGVLAIEIETNFNTSSVLPQSHFCAICEQLLPHGFTLFDLAFNRIPRSSFAARAQALGITETLTIARPATVNALFYREGAANSADELLKRVAILEIYGMADTAYDVLMAGAELWPTGFPMRAATDLLIKRAMVEPPAEISAVPAPPPVVAAHVHSGRAH